MREMTAPPGTQTIAGQKMTLEEFSRLPKDGTKYELLGGKVSMTPAGLQHEEIGVKLLAAMIKYLEQQPLGHLYGSSAGFRLSDDTVLSPDLSFVRSERLPTGRSPQGYGNFAPDLAIEIISPNDLMSELEAKVQLYLDNGTRLVWVINPQLRSATIYRADGTLRRVHDKESLDGEDVLPGFACHLADIL
jgi:Uma2 family endonuclease